LEKVETPFSNIRGHSHDSFERFAVFILDRGPGCIKNLEENNFLNEKLNKAK
jgi:hypothetical protein